MSEMGFEELVSTGNPAPFMSQMIDQGMSARAGLATYRDAGGHIADRAWYRGYGELRDTYARRSDFMTASLDQTLSADQLGSWAAGRAGTYGYQATVVLVDRETGLASTMVHMVMTDEELTPAEVNARAIAAISNAAGDSDYLQGQRIVGASLTGAWQMTGPAT